MTEKKDKIIQIAYAPKGSLDEGDDFDVILGLSETGNLYFYTERKLDGKTVKEWQKLNVPHPKITVDEI